MVRAYTTDRSPFPLPAQESASVRFLRRLKLPVAIGVIVATLTQFALSLFSNLPPDTISRVGFATSGTLAGLTFAFGAYQRLTRS